MGGIFILKVYIVEDELYIRMELMELIDWKRYGFIMDGCAKNGKEALISLKEHPVDLIITDIEMPQMGGIELIKEIRKINQDTQVIFLTGFSEFQYAQQGVKLGVVDYLLKPIEPEELIESIKKVKDKIVDNKIKNISDSNNSNINYRQAMIKKAQRFVYENIEEEITLNSISKHLNISKNYFSTLYKQETGENFIDFIIKEKINKAKEMLVEENLKIYEVAEKLGYLDKSHFSKVFKKVVGVTPQDYKRGMEMKCV